MKRVILGLLLTCIPCFVMEIPSQAQDQANEIRCSGTTSCRAGLIPVFATNGGSATVQNSKVKQISNGISVAGNVFGTGATFSGDMHTGGNVFATGATFSGDTHAGGTVFGNAGSFTGDVSAGGNVSGVAGNFTGNVSGVIGNFSGNVFGNDGSFSGNLFGTIGTLNNLGAGAGTALFVENNDTPQTLQLDNAVAPSGSAFMEAQFNGFGNAVFYTTTTGDMVAMGTKSAAVALRNGKFVKMFAIESPENWFEDYGTANLLGGMATVKLDPTFVQTVVTGHGYRVFLTPNGDCHGLYVSQKTPTSFEVRELSGGTSSVSFDYRIAAHRRGYDKERMPVAVMPKKLTPLRPSR